jgi:hypothetical protein
MDNWIKVERGIRYHEQASAASLDSIETGRLILGLVWV